MHGLLQRCAFFALLTAAGACLARGNSPREEVYVGSTPGDAAVRSLLKIDPSADLDFIRWILTLNTTGNKYLLQIHFGASQPNTMGFKGAGTRQSFEGSYRTTVDNPWMEGTVYRLNTQPPDGEITLLRISENLLHVLTPEGRLMVGNGGWSYTLSSRTSAARNTFAAFSRKHAAADDPARVVFDGRTPCQEFASDQNISVSTDCFKLKWRLILYRDSLTHLPTTYTMRKVVDNNPRDVSGNWTILTGSASQSAILYRLDPGVPGKSITFVLADDNILYLMARDNTLFTGNENFSYTLNKVSND